jgi:nitrogen regulatory protein PII
MHVTSNIRISSQIFLVGSITVTSNDITTNKEAHGMIFVKDVSDAYEIGTKVSGEAALSAAK